MTIPEDFSEDVPRARPRMDMTAFGAFGLSACGLHLVLALTGQSGAVQAQALMALTTVATLLGLYILGDLDYDQAS